LREETKKQEFWGWFGKLDTCLGQSATRRNEAGDPHNPFISILWIYKRERLSECNFCGQGHHYAMGTYINGGRFL
jgi:hypothetical protein